METFFGYSISLIMLGLMLIHLYWGHGGNWPGQNRQDLIDKVYGEGSKFPSIYACYAVAAILGAACILSLTSAGILSELSFSKHVTWPNYVVATGFFLRGILGYLPALEKKWTQVFIFYNRRIYNPLCIGLGLGYIYLAQA